jgi:PAB-dependent poly(A)-specific ribonuclease subunit 3
MHIPERTLWSYTVQLCNALRAIHDEGLAARMVGELTKVLVTGKERVRINCCGMLDVLGYDGGSNIAQQQVSSAIINSLVLPLLLPVGHLLLSLASLNPSASSPQHLPKSLDHLSRAYSVEFRDLVLFLLGLAKNGKSPSGIGEVLSMIGGRVFDELSASMK